MKTINMKNEAIVSKQHSEENSFERFSLVTTIDLLWCN